MSDCPYGAGDCPKVGSISDRLDKIDLKITELSSKMDDSRLQTEVRFTKLETTMKNMMVAFTVVVSIVAVIVGIMEVII